MLVSGATQGAAHGCAQPVAGVTLLCGPGFRRARLLHVAPEHVLRVQRGAAGGTGAANRAQAALDVFVAVFVDDERWSCVEVFVSVFVDVTAVHLCSP